MQGWGEQARFDEIDKHTGDRAAMSDPESGIRHVAPSGLAVRT
jgi:hypothetical protein